MIKVESNKEFKLERNSSEVIKQINLHDIGLNQISGTNLYSYQSAEYKILNFSIKPKVIFLINIEDDNIYLELKKQNIDVLLDDTEESMSSKFNKHDLLGIPYQIIIGSKSSDNKFEFKEVNGESSIVDLQKIKSKLKK